MDTIALFFDLEEELSDCRHIRQKIRSMAKGIFLLPDAQFIKQFRLNKAGFKYILDELKAKLPPVVRSSSLTPEFKFAACLRFLAEGGYQTGTGQDFNVGMAQSMVVLSDIFNILEETQCPKWITLTMSEEDEREARLFFYEKSRIPGVIMCVDGTHIKVAKPAVENAHLFYNRKGAYSLNTMIICDHKQRMPDLDARYPGASHDSSIWGNSDAYFYFKSLYDNGERNMRLLGDAGYPLSPWLITPYRSPGVDTPESRFNSRHSRGRNIVERTIGVWKKWCRCCLGARQLHYSPQKAVQFINVSAAIHNIRIHFNVFDEEHESIEEVTQVEDSHPHNTQTEMYILQDFI